MLCGSISMTGHRRWTIQAALRDYTLNPRRYYQVDINLQDQSNRERSKLGVESVVEEAEGSTKIDTKMASAESMTKRMYNTLEPP
jgi:hypothetical protein